MAEFYDNEVTGKMHLRATAGAGTGVWDAPATPADIKAFYTEHQAYLVAKAAAKAKVEAEAEADHGQATIDAKAAVETLTEEKAALEHQVETLSAAVDKL
jgi:hypothetical protein